MATAVSTADLAVLLVDARKGLLTQTFRHSHIVSLMGIERVVVAINKMDLVNWDMAIFDKVAAAYRDFASALKLAEVICIPISALRGDNVARPSLSMDWYDGPSLLAYLEAVDTAPNQAVKPFRMPVQWINRPDQNFRGYGGTIASGVVRPGDRIVVLPSGFVTQIARLMKNGGGNRLCRSG
jgi:bifunctional enzyme CysN/CysC